MKKSTLMSAFLLISCLALWFTGCSEKETIYQVVNNMDYYESSINYLDGSMYEVIVFQMKGSDVIREDNITKISYGGGKSDVLAVDKSCEKIKVSFRLLPKQSPYYDLTENNRKYTVATYPIEKDKSNRIIIDNNTMVSDSFKSVEKSAEQGVSVIEVLDSIVR